MHSWQHGLVRKSSSSTIGCERIIALAEFTLCLMIIVVAVFQLWCALTMRSYARKLYARDASKLVDGIYRDNARINDLEFTVSLGPSGHELTGTEGNEHIDVAGGPWTCFGEFAGGITRWMR